MRAGDRIKLKNHTEETGFLGGHLGTVREIEEDQVRIILDPTKTTAWMGREFWTEVRAQAYEPYGEM